MKRKTNTGKEGQKCLYCNSKKVTLKDNSIRCKNCGYCYQISACIRTKPEFLLHQVIYLFCVLLFMVLWVFFMPQDKTLAVFTLISFGLFSFCVICLQFGDIRVRSEHLRKKGIVNNYYISEWLQTRKVLIIFQAICLSFVLFWMIAKLKGVIPNKTMDVLGLVYSGAICFGLVAMQIAEMIRELKYLKKKNSRGLNNK